VRLFSDFYISDIIIASPLGLRLAMGAPTKGGKAPDNKKAPGGKDGKSGGKSNELTPDFLSSVEMVLLHQADVMYMQNWEHVEYVMKYANRLPTAAHETDFARVRQYFLEGKAAQHRQLLLTSHFNDPELQAFFRENAKSIAGSVRLKRNWGQGTISNVVTDVKQVFQLVPNVRDFASQEEARFQYFKEHVLAPLLRIQQSHTLIVTPSYLNYVRVRNEMMHQDVSVCLMVYCGL
jgi:U3 small nucleolar RNA-associated protein 25